MQGVNLMAVIWGIEIFGPLIEKHAEGGQIVSTASVAGSISGGGLMPYNVSKYGVVARSEGLRTSLAARGIGVSAIDPRIGAVSNEKASAGEVEDEDEDEDEEAGEEDVWERQAECETPRNKAGPLDEVCEPHQIRCQVRA